MKSLLFALLGLFAFTSVKAQEEKIFVVDVELFSAKIDSIVTEINSLSRKERRKMNVDKCRKYVFINNSKYRLEFLKTGDGLLTLKGDVVYDYYFTSENFEIIEVYLHLYIKKDILYKNPMIFNELTSRNPFYKSFEDRINVNRPLLDLDINPELVNQDDNILMKEKFVKFLDTMFLKQKCFIALVNLSKCLERLGITDSVKNEYYADDFNNYRVTFFTLSELVEISNTYETFNIFYKVEKSHIQSVEMFHVHDSEIDYGYLYEILQRIMPDFDWGLMELEKKHERAKKFSETQNY